MMMEILDIRTIAVIFFINSLVATLFMAALWRQSRKQFLGISLWLTSFVLLTAAFVLVSLRNVIPDVASILIANTCVAAAAFILYLGLERFVACPSSQRHNYVILAVFVGLFTYFTFFQSDVAIRIVLLNVTLMLMFLQSSWLMLHRVGSQLKPLSRAMGIICLMYVLVWCYRLILVFFVPTPGDYLNMHFSDAIGLLIGQILTIGLVLVLILMVNRRMSLNILNQEETLIRSKVESEISNRDLTEHKRIEATLRESEIRYRDLVNFSKNGVAIYEATADGEDFIFKDFNRAAERIDNVKKEDIIGKSVLQTFPGVKEFGLFEVFQRVWRTGVPVRHPIARYHDERISVWRDNYVYRLSSGEIVAIYEDVTARKQAEEALQVSEVKYRTLFESFPLGITISDSAGNIIESNKEAARLLGLSIEEQSKRQIDGREWHIIRPDGSPMPANDYASVRALKENRLIENVEMGIVKYDSDVIWINVTAAPILLEGYGVAITYGDITQRKLTELKLLKSEALLKEAQGVAHIGHWELDLATMIPAWSEEIFHLFGIDPATREPSFAAHRDLLYPDDWDILNNAVSATITTEAPFDIKFRLLHPVKGIRWLHAIGQAIRDNDGKISRLFGTAQDITELNKIDLELQNSHDHLRNLMARLQISREDERKNIAAEIHDDLGQSLVALQIDLSWLMKRIPHDQTQLLEKAESMLSMLKVIDERVREIATELRPPLLDDLGFVPAAQSYLSEFEERTGIKCEFTSEPEEIILDANVSIALFRVLQGVLTNTAKHTRATLVKISLAEQTDGLYMEISDNGRGITEKEIASRKSIGIIGMRERIAFFGGSLQIEGRRGKGTTVKLKIPVQRDMFE